MHVRSNNMPLVGNPLSYLNLLLYGHNNEGEWTKVSGKLLASRESVRLNHTDGTAFVPQTNKGISFNDVVMPPTAAFAAMRYGPAYGGGEGGGSIFYAKPAVHAIDIGVSDNICRVPGVCQLGHHVDAATNDCVLCESGKFNPGTTRSTECSPKVFSRFNERNVSTTCGAGYYYSKPIGDAESKSRDDWRCIVCPSGTYSSASSWSTVTDMKISDGTTCTLKDAARSQTVCPAGEEIYRGGSLTDDDWFCAPAARFTTLCARVTKTDARSIQTGLVTGLPERIVYGA
jgi:hypothetical protein